MKFAIVSSKMLDKRPKKKTAHHVEALRVGDKVAHVHFGHNAIPADLWDAVKDCDRAVKLLKSGDLKYEGEQEVKGDLKLTPDAKPAAAQA